eukprot:8901493-Pyramimonas_sp.AAC.1
MSEWARARAAAASASLGGPTPEVSLAPAACARGSGGPGCATAAGKYRSSHQCHPHALVIEDLRTACAELRARGCMCDRIARAEVVTSTGTQYLGSVLSGDYQLLWVATP